MQNTYAHPSNLYATTKQVPLPNSPIGDFFNDQDDMEINSETRSIDTPTSVKCVRQDSVRMRQAAGLATPSTAIIENISTPSYITSHSMTQASSLSPPSNKSAFTNNEHYNNINVNQPITSSTAAKYDTPPKQQPQPQQSHSQPQTIIQNPVESMLQSGIQYHEAGQLEKATDCFRHAAAKDSPMGMFLYGVSLRHGWGCKKSEQLAFQYLQKAAEHAVLDLNSLSSTVNTSVSKGELIMAIYEMGVSFRHGWGCKKNKETAVHFFKIAADLGDPDAQNDLGHCYYHGQGIKKDLHLAAKYYRKADKQGHGLLGNSWIWKKKYD